MSDVVMSATSDAEFVAKIPPKTIGCKVFTRPPSISGAPVKSLTSLCIVKKPSNKRRKLSQNIVGTQLNIGKKFNEKCKNILKFHVVYQNIS